MSLGVCQMSHLIKKGIFGAEVINDSLVSCKKDILIKVLWVSKKIGTPKNVSIFFNGFTFILDFWPFLLEISWWKSEFWPYLSEIQN